MGRQPCCEKVGFKRGPWTIEEDRRLMSFILNNGIQCWRLVPKLAGLLRCGKSCRLRWINYLRPDLKRGLLSEAEEDQIIELHACLGNRWSKIASHFPGRTDNEIKNHWNTRIKKRLKLQGIDPLTHQPILEPAKQNVQEKATGPDKPVLGNVQTTPSPNDNQTNQTWDVANMTSRSESSSSIHMINNYEMMSRSYPDMDLLWMTNRETNYYVTSYSPSFSLEDSVSYPESTVSIDGSSGTMQQYWLDQSVDSLLSWDGIDNLDQNLLFSEIRQ